MIFANPITLGLFLILACGSDAGSVPDPEQNDPTEDALEAVVTEVIITGSEGSFQFNVTIKSPDTGCEQYANWWEVLSIDGKLLYRRILTHSHVNEQPFSRSGGPVSISDTDSIFVRGHMHPFGYGTNAFTGSIQTGLIAVQLDSTFASEVEKQSPLPGPCVF